MNHMPRWRTLRVLKLGAVHVPPEPISVHLTYSRSNLNSKTQEHPRPGKLHR